MAQKMSALKKVLLGGGATSALAVGAGAIGTGWAAFTGKTGTPQDLLTKTQDALKTAGVESSVGAFFHGIYAAIEELGALLNRIPGFEGLGDDMIRWSQNAMSTETEDTITTSAHDDTGAPGATPDNGSTHASLMGGPDGGGTSLASLAVPAGLGLGAGGYALAKNAHALATSRVMPSAFKGAQGDLFDGTNDAPRGKFGRILKTTGIVTATAGVGIGGTSLMTSEANAGELPVGSTDLAGTNMEAYAHSEINLGSSFAEEAAAPTEESFLDAAAHKGHVFAHGVQDGLAGLVGSPEDLYDMVDGWTGDWLPGDANSNSTYDFVKEVADDHLIGPPEIRDEWDARVHAGGSLATWAIPVGGALKAAGAGAKAVNATKAFEATENVVGGTQIGGMVAEAGLNFIKP